MGMGSYAVSSFVIGYDDLKKLCPKEISAIEKEEYFDVIGWGNLARFMTWDDPDAIADDVIDSVGFDDLDDSEKLAEEVVTIYDKHLNSLQKAFKKKTKLELYFDHYDEDGGDRYDNPNDKDGCIFCVNGVMVLSPAGKKYQDIITERRWTQFG